MNKDGFFHKQGKYIVIAIIDDGVSKNVIDTLHFDKFIEPSVPRYIVPEYSHGSICAWIIKKYISVPHCIGSVKVLYSSTSTGNMQDLVDAIIWCANNKIDVIHLSLGSVNPPDYLALMEASKYAHEQGCIIVAACKNQRNFSLPASSNYTIGVACDPKLVDGAYRVNPKPNVQIDFLASSQHTLVLSSDQQKYDTEICNSYAAPLITALVCNEVYQQDTYTMDSIKASLALKSGEIVSHHYYTIEPCEKTILCCLLSNNEQPYPSHLSADQYIVTNSVSEIVAYVDRCKVDIIGLYMDDKMYANSSMLSSLLQTLYCKGVHVSFLSHSFPGKMLYQMNRIYDPGLLNLYNGDGNVDVPVIVLTADDSKFIAQRIKEHLQELGYNILLLSDYIEHFLSGFTFLLSEKRIAGVIGELVKHYHAEAICIILDPEKGLPIGIDVDIHIHCSKEEPNSLVKADYSLFYEDDKDNLFESITNILIE